MDPQAPDWRSLADGAIRAASFAEPGKSVQFGRFSCRGTQVFWESEHSLGLVNLKPIVPGHVLIISKRVTPRIGELSEVEMQDLFLSARTVAAGIGKVFESPSFNLAVQDGAEAGQTVPHVHVHIIPRKAQDFERNDEVYEKLDEFDARPPRLKVPADSERVARSEEEMAEEGARLRAAFVAIRDQPA
eukprot:CAMPEP_0177695180 /NCGR_PEP_ID=MMETSP0484_2-20121128/3323_1 /TAXON_ID=354590 /ORGANISM="Rhodomonas lens, Strain RHODO" /LENGTH=187 /DNA_ID=CAMNT_0019206095 /DNA_START=8 /DNA_END=571 /DNA_ORIENTATION=-